MYSPLSWCIKNSKENAFDRGEWMLLNCHKRKTCLMKVFYILIWANSMVCVQSGHFNSWKALSFLLGRLMPGTSTVICRVDGFAVECTRRLWEDFLVPVVLSLLYHQADWHRNSFGEQRPAREQTGPKRALRCGWEIVNWEASRTELSRHYMHGMVGKNGNPSRKSVGKQNPKIVWATVSICLPFKVFSFFFSIFPQN